MKKLHVFLFVSLAALLFTSCSNDQEITINNEIKAVIDGYVFNSETGTPVDGVLVTISDKAVRTNASGYFKVTGLSTGDYCFKFEKEGFVSMLDCYIVSVPGQDFYGDQVQSSFVSNITPSNKNANITFRYQDSGDWFDAPANLNVKVSYTNNSIISIISDKTTNSSGAITLNNIAYSQIRVEIDQIIDDVRYTVNKTISASMFEQLNGNIRVQISSAAVTTTNVDL